MVVTPVVRHLSREISKECCLFIHHGDSITGIVKDRRPITLKPCGEMELTDIL